MYKHMFSNDHIAYACFTRTPARVGILDVNPRAMLRDAAQSRPCNSELIALASDGVAAGFDVRIPDPDYSCLEIDHQSDEDFIAAVLAIEPRCITLRGFYVPDASAYDALFPHWVTHSESNGTCDEYQRSVRCAHVRKSDGRVMCVLDTLTPRVVSVTSSWYDWLPREWQQALAANEAAIADYHKRARANLERRLREAGLLK